MIAIFRKLWLVVDAQDRRQLLALSIPMLLVALLELASISLIVPVAQILLGETEKFTMLVPEDLRYLVSPTSVLGAFIALFLLKNASLLGLTHLVNVVIHQQMARFLSNLFDAYMSRPLQFHQQTNSAIVLRNLISGSGLTFDCIRLTIMMGLETLLMVTAIAIITFSLPGVTLILAVILGIVGLVYSRFSGPVFRRWGERTMIEEGRLIQWVNQALSTIREIKLLGIHGFASANVADAALRRGKYLGRSATGDQAPRLLIETVMVIMFVILLSSLVVTSTDSGEALTMLGLFGMAGLRIMPSMNRLLQNIGMIKQRSAYIDTLSRDLAAARSDSDLPPAGTIPAPLEFREQIEFVDVGFSYDGADRTAVSGLNLTIPRGASIGIVGASGAGKTTLVDLLLGLLPADTGTIRIDGQDIGACRHDWQRTLGYVPQSAALIDDTIARNIAFGLSEEAIDPARLDHAIDLAQLRKVIDDLPDGIETVLGEQGARLSGGQRQRIAIARALYRDPQVLVFDEATSALDNRTEADISQAIGNIAGDKTVIIIAHRLSTVKACDSILFMEDGKLLDQGAFEELVERNAAFRDLTQTLTASAT
jgi:ATP-binding cassette subfamily C protein